MVKPVKKNILKKLQVNEVFAANVKANSQNKDNSSLEVSRGELYNFFVPKGEYWYDFFFIRSTASGFNFPFFRQKLKQPQARYFELCGEIIENSSSRSFIIGEQLNNFECTESGSLILFANDVPGFYFNNRGSIRVWITRTK